jgi:hypothetical protein
MLPPAGHRDEIALAKRPAGPRLTDRCGAERLQRGIAAEDQLHGCGDVLIGSS